MQRTHRLNRIPVKTEVLTALKGQREELDELVTLCNTTIADVENIAKEVGGDPEKSPRYIESRLIRDRVLDLIHIMDGKFTYILPGVDQSIKETWPA